MLNQSKRTGRKMLATQLSTRRRWIAAGFVLLLLILRVVYARNYRIDSDEVQHLHVVWGWGQGMLPYRDFFDNHMPLFHIVSAPIFRWFGVRPDIVVPMRLLMNGLFALNLWCVWKLASQFFSRADALIGTALVALCSPFFFGSLEYRTDNLWTVFWMLSLLLIASGPITRLRAFLIGLALGAATVVSMKSVMLLVALCLAWILLGRVVPETRRNFLAWHPAHLLAGLVALPAVVALYFIAQSAGREFYYCVIQHNLIPEDKPQKVTLIILKAFLVIALATAFARLIGRSSMVPKSPTRAVYLLLASASYLAILVLCRTEFTITGEDYLPLWPALGAIVAPWISKTCSFRRSKKSIAGLIPIGLIAIEFIFVIIWQPPWWNKAATKIGIVADTLRLTSSQDYVIDGKGETIYRPRPAYWVYEGITLKRIKRGLIIDDLPEKLIASRTPVASLNRLPDTSKEFVEANYLPVAFRLRALGKILFIPKAINEAPPPSIGFEIAIPNRYMILAERGEAIGTLDQTPLDAPRELAAGQHIVRLTSGTGRIALIWAQAVERGYSPFRTIKADWFDETD